MLSKAYQKISWYQLNVGHYSILYTYFFDLSLSLEFFSVQNWTYKKIVYYLFNFLFKNDLLEKNP